MDTTSSTNSSSRSRITPRTGTSPTGAQHNTTESTNNSSQYGFDIKESTSDDNASSLVSHSSSSVENEQNSKKTGDHINKQRGSIKAAQAKLDPRYFNKSRTSQAGKPRQNSTRTSTVPRKILSSSSNFNSSIEKSSNSIHNKLTSTKHIRLYKEEWQEEEYSFHQSSRESNLDSTTVNRFKERVAQKRLQNLLRIRKAHQIIKEC